MGMGPSGGAPWAALLRVKLRDSPIFTSDVYTSSFRSTVPEGRERCSWTLGVLSWFIESWGGREGGREGGEGREGGREGGKSGERDRENERKDKGNEGGRDREGIMGGGGLVSGKTHNFGIQFLGICQTCKTFDFLTKRKPTKI